MTQYTNIAVTPEGHLRPWPRVKATVNPPVLKFDGQITWLPNKMGKLSNRLNQLKEQQHDPQTPS